jgi:hypothetical protein
MPNMPRKISFLLLIACCLFATQVPGADADAPSPEKLVAEHVKAIGNPAMLSKVKSVTLIGTADANFILGMVGSMKGTSMLISEGPKIGITFKFSDINYPGEYFAFDGTEVTVQNMKPGLKSPIADFLYRYNKMMKQGLISGVFSNAWPLLDIKNHPKVKMKTHNAKVDGKELYELEYQPEDWFGDMKIRMFFEPGTYRHVRTEYKVRTTDDASAGFNPSPDTHMAIGQVKGESYYTLVEKFEDFKKVGAFTLPHRYILHYMIDGPAQSGFIADWTLNAQQIGFNTPNINPKVFQAEK